MPTTSQDLSKPLTLITRGRMLQRSVTPDQFDKINEMIQHFVGEYLFKARPNFRAYKVMLDTAEIRQRIIDEAVTESGTPFYPRDVVRYLTRREFKQMVQEAIYDFLKKQGIDVYDHNDEDHQLRVHWQPESERLELEADEAEEGNEAEEANGE